MKKEENIAVVVVVMAPFHWQIPRRYLAPADDWRGDAYGQLLYSLPARCLSNNTHIRALPRGASQCKAPIQKDAYIQPASTRRRHMQQLCKAGMVGTLAR